MNPLALSVLLFAGVFVLRSSGAPDPLSVELWPGKPPGDFYPKGPESSRVYESPIVGPTRLVTNVTKPSLMVYLPPPSQNTGTAMVICPGGGYWDLFIDLEGAEVAAWLNRHGMAGIVVKYRVPRSIPGVPPPGPEMDVQRALRLVRSRAAEWRIDPRRIGVIGFSVGGHLALAAATNFDRPSYEQLDAVDRTSSRPDFAVLCYSGYLKETGQDRIWPGLSIPANTPPVMLVHCTDDHIANAEESAVMYLALKRAGVAAELHIYATGDHDFGVRNNERLPSSWTSLCLSWLRSFRLLGDRP
jgi:acetyl esterase/lipase